MKDYISKKFDVLRKCSLSDMLDKKVDDLLVEILIEAHRYVVDQAEAIPLISGVEDKSYLMFAKDGNSTRPVNESLFLQEFHPEDFRSILDLDCGIHSKQELRRILYTAGCSFSLFIDLVSPGNQKSPGTFFEILCGRIVAKMLNVHPSRSVTAPSLDLQITLPTDFIFELPDSKTRFHLPIKLSTRERVIQVWAHQRVLDGMHGAGRFVGILICFAETNKQRNKSVVEVCLPNQWAAYQMYIAQMTRVYYFDPPKKYLDLKRKYPYIPVNSIETIFDEINDLITI